MKKISILLITILSCVLLIHAGTYSSRIFGTTEIDLLPAGVQRMMSCSFNTNGDNTLLSILGTSQLRQNVTLANCDTVSIWQADTSLYQVWAQFTDGKFYKANDISEWTLKIEGDPIVEHGQAFWIKSPDSSSATNTIFITGEVESAPEKTMSIHRGYQMISYPFAETIDLNDLEFTTDSGYDHRFLFMNDHITTSDGVTHQKYGLYNDNKWYKANSGSEWSGKTLSTATLEHGSGIWYESKKNFTWTETNKYESAFE